MLILIPSCGAKQEPVTRDEQELSPQKIDEAMVRLGKIKQLEMKRFPNVNERGATARVLSSGYDNKFGYADLNLTSQSGGNSYTVTAVRMSDYHYKRFAQELRLEIQVDIPQEPQGGGTPDDDWGSSTRPSYPTGGGTPDSDWDRSRAPSQNKGTGTPDEDWDTSPIQQKQQQQPQKKKKGGTPDDDWSHLFLDYNPFVSTAHAQTVSGGMYWATVEDTDISKSSLSIDFMVGNSSHKPTRCTMTLNRNSRGLYDTHNKWIFNKKTDKLTCNDQWAVKAHKTNEKGKVTKQAGRIHAGGISAAIQGH